MCLTLLVRTELDRKKNVVGQANVYEQVCIVFIALYMPILERLTYWIINIYFCHLSALIVPLDVFLSFMRKQAVILSFMRKPPSIPAGFHHAAAIIFGSTAFSGRQPTTKQQNYVRK